MLTGPFAPADEEVLIRQFVRAFLERSEDLRFFLHEDAEMTLVVTGGETVRGRDALLPVLLGRDPRFEVTAARIEPLGDDGALVEGFFRARQPDGTVLERAAAWLHEFRDGLIWRVRVYEDAEKARSAFRARSA